MKVSIIPAAAMTAASVHAQITATQPTQTYTTTIYDDCPSVSLSSMITVTQGVTATYCPECEMSSSAGPALPGYTTVYTTTYLSLCPTGIVPATYTVTESCTEATPTWTPGSSHIPNGFTVTTKQCTVCDTTPTAVTITEPCGCEATNGVPMSNGNAVPTPIPAAPKITPNGGSGPGNGISPGTGSGASGPSAAPPACNGEGCGGNGNQGLTGVPAGVPAGAPAGSPTGTPPCNGENCGGSGSQSPPMPEGAAPNAQPNSGGSNLKSVPAAQAPPYPTSLVSVPSVGGASPGNNSGGGNGNESGSGSNGAGAGAGITPSEGGASSSIRAGFLTTSLILAIVAGASVLDC